jgi:hypothetical protein
MDKEIQIDLNKIYLGYFVYVNSSVNNCYGIIQLIERNPYPYKRINLVYAPGSEIKIPFRSQDWLKFKTGDFVTLKIKESKSEMFKYEAFEAKQPKERIEFLKNTFEESPSYSSLKWLCLGLDESLVNEYIEKQTDKYRMLLKEVDDFINYSTKKKIIDALIVEVETGGRWKPGDDDSMYAWIKAKYTGFESQEHIYLKERFSYSKEVYSDRGYVPYSKMIEEYKSSNEYKDHLAFAEEIKKFLTMEINIRYNFEEHKKKFVEVCNKKIEIITQGVLDRTTPNKTAIQSNGWS